MKRHALLLLFLLFTIVCHAQTVYKTRTGAKYHVQTCRYLKSSIATTVAAAQAEGLTACSVCRPASGNAPPTTHALQGSGSTLTASPESSSSSSSGSVQCTGTTKAGAQCKRTTSSSNGRCYQHTNTN